MNTLHRGTGRTSQPSCLHMRRALRRPLTCTGFRSRRLAASPLCTARGPRTAAGSCRFDIQPRCGSNRRSRSRLMQSASALQPSPFTFDVLGALAFAPAPAPAPAGAPLRPLAPATASVDLAGEFAPLVPAPALSPRPPEPELPDAPSARGAPLSSREVGVASAGSADSPRGCPASAWVLASTLGKMQPTTGKTSNQCH